VSGTPSALLEDEEDNLKTNRCAILALHCTPVVMKESEKATICYKKESFTFFYVLKDLRVLYYYLIILGHGVNANPLMKPRTLRVGMHGRSTNA